MSEKLSRRQVIRGSAVAAAGVAMSRMTRPAQGALGANERVRMAVAGIKGRGGSHIDAFGSMKGDVEVAYLVDPDSTLFDSRNGDLEKKGGYKAQCVQDIRRVLDDKTVDAVSIATPNHWHSLMTIWACQAGKDVYVEKPMSHNVHEGRIAVEAARKYKRIVQHGTQNRSDANWWKVAAHIKKGTFGKVLVSRGLCYKNRGSIGFKEPKSPPSTLDFNLWLGPAQEHAYHENLVHYNWHWFWDFGNGDIGNQGVHQMDVARWMTGETLPKRVFSLGGRFGYEDQGQTANTQIAVFDYGNDKPQVIFEVRGLKTDQYYGQGTGNVIHCEEATIVGNNKFIPRGSSEAQKLPPIDVEIGPGSGPFGNFIAAVRSRKESDLNAPVLEAHLSSALCHLANVSYRLGTEVEFSQSREMFGTDLAAAEAFARMRENLKDDNGLPINEMTYRLGRTLAFNPKTERFKDDAEADAMLTRDYRKEFSVPDSLA